MEAISNAAKRAAQDEQERRFSTNDFESNTGATVGSAYLVSQDDEQDFVMVVTGVGHYEDDYKFTNEDIWRRPQGVDEDEFLKGVYLEAEFYNIKSFLGEGAFETHDEPFETPRIPRAALSKFPRKPLDEATKDNTFALPM